MTRYTISKGQNTMGRGFDIPYIEGSKYHGYRVQYTMDKGLDIPWVGGLNTMGRGPI